MPPKKPTSAVRGVIYWFRTDLRLHDSPALKAALDLQPKHFYPVWCWDPHYVYEQKVGPNRWQFLLDSMSNVSSSITKLNPSSQLYVLRGAPNHVLPILFKAWDISHIVWEKDVDHYALTRDSEIQSLASQAGVESIILSGHTLYDPQVLLKTKLKNKPPTAYGPFVKLLQSLPTPAQPLPAPDKLPDPGPTDLPSSPPGSESFAQSGGLEKYEENDVNSGAFAGEPEDKDRGYGSSLKGPKGDFGVPEWKELGLVEATTEIRGGEDKALEVLENWLKDEGRIRQFRKPKTDPSEWGVGKAATTQLSPHLKFGTLSVRLFWHRLREIEKKGGHSDPPESLVGQLYWREMFHTAMAGTENWTQMRGNPICRFIDWRLQNEYNSEGERNNPAYTPGSDPEAEAFLLAWKMGRTGFPWIDAIMRQMRRDGWIHHLARHSVACFLTRGHGYISWERGAEVFDEYLIDWDPAMNTANWMWLSCSAFFSQYYRVYSPIAFGRKYPNAGDYIREYVPELKDFPEKHIFEPWKAPKDAQKKAKCIIGEDYPEPIVDEKEAKQKCLDGMKAAYALKLNGDNPRVLDGSAQDEIRSSRGKDPLPHNQRPVDGIEAQDEDDDITADHPPEEDEDQEEEKPGSKRKTRGGNKKEDAEEEPDKKRAKPVSSGGKKPASKGKGGGASKGKPAKDGKIEDHFKKE